MSAQRVVYSASRIAICVLIQNGIQISDLGKL